MHILDKGTHIDFMGKRKLAMGFSLILILISLVMLFTRGLSFGIDFTGGTLIEVAYPDAVELGGIRDVLQEAGFSDIQVQHFGTARDVLDPHRAACRYGQCEAQRRCHDRAEGRRFHG